MPDKINLNLYDWVRKGAPVDYQTFFESLAKMFLQGVRRGLSRDEAKKAVEEIETHFLRLVEVHNEYFGVNGVKGNPPGKDKQRLRDIRIRMQNEDACQQKK